MDDAILSGIAGGFQGVSQGLSRGIQDAQAIQSTENSRQNMAINADLLKRTQAEETRSNAPVYKEDVAKRVPKEMQEWFLEDQTKGKWQKGADGREFMPQRDLNEHKETLNHFDKYQGVTKGIEFLSKENQGYEEKIKPLSDFMNQAKQDGIKKYQEIKESKGIVAAEEYKQKEMEKLKDPESVTGSKYKELMDLAKPYKENQKKIGMYQGQLTGADESVKKMIEAHPGIDLNDIMVAWGGGEGSKEAQMRIQEAVKLGQSKPDNAHNITEIPSPDGTTAQKMQYNPQTQRYDIPVGEPYTAKSQVINVNAAPSGEKFRNWETPDKELTFMTKMITNKEPKFAFGDRESYTSFGKEYNHYLNQKGLKAGDVALMQADYKSGSMSLNNMTKQEAPMSAFVKNINKQVDTVDSLYQELQRTDVRALDLPIRELKMKLKGSGVEKALDLFMQEISAESIKLSQGSSASIAQIPEGARKDWIRIHDSSLSLKEITPVLRATKKMANMRMSTWTEAKEKVREALGGIGSSDAAPVSNYNDFDVKLPPGATVQDVVAELKKRKKTGR